MSGKEYVEKLNEVCKPVFESIEEKLKSGEVVYVNDVARACKAACEKEGIASPFVAYRTDNNIGWVLEF